MSGGEVLAFNPRGTAATAARLHRAGCQFLGRFKPYQLTSSANAEQFAAELRNLEQLGWKVVRCKCLGGGK